MKIAIGSDHAGFILKQQIIDYYMSKDVSFFDVGTNNTDSCDYPVFGQRVAVQVSKSLVDFGIVICGTGIGISIAANKIKGIRAALIYDVEHAILAKEHNRANVIAFGARDITIDVAIKCIDAYTNATFEDRHQKRLDLLSKIEDGELV